jgi:ankyrin repeat protein
MQEKLEKGKTRAINPVSRLLNEPLSEEVQYQLNNELTQAAAQGRIADVKRLIGEGADINAFSDSRTSLVWAAWNGNTQICALLLDNGADINAKDGTNGWTALRLAASNGHTETCAFLLDRGAEIEVKNEKCWVNGWTPLHYAAEHGHTETCALLISQYVQAGSDAKEFINRKSAEVNNCKTALMLAAANGYTETCAFLVGKGADAETIDSFGSAALYWARRNGKMETGAFLKSIKPMRKRMGKEGYGWFISAFGECISA